MASGWDQDDDGAERAPVASGFGLPLLAFAAAAQRLAGAAALARIRDTLEEIMGARAPDAPAGNRPPSERGPKGDAP